jgi:type IV secretory pathway TraG/TraD family ATPase VirD4
VPTFEAAARQFLETNDRTQSSITTTIMPALGWLQHETAAAAAHATRTGTSGTVGGPGAADGGEGDPFAGSFDVERLLAERGTVYLLGAEDAQTAPLVTALTGHIAREARRLAAKQATGRLEPSLTLALDEAAIICPLPLESWTADMGGANITLHIGAQSRAQLRQRYGQAGAATIFNNTATVLIFGGTRDDEDLAAYVTLAGERDEDVATFDHLTRRTSTTIRRVPVLTAAQIAQLPFRKVLIIRRGMPAALGRVKMAWRRRDVRRDQRRRRWATRRATWAKRASAWWTVGTQTAVDWAAPRLERSAERALTEFERFLVWLDSDPIGSVVRRVRGRRATRRAKAAIRALPARPSDAVTDSDGVSSTAGRRSEEDTR